MDIKLSRTRKITYITIFLLAVLFQSNACLAAKKPRSAIVSMYDSYFDPSTITISRGQKVIWVNKGEKDHEVSINSVSFYTGHISPGSSVSYTFSKPGGYTYACAMHSFLGFGMKGKVIVK